MNLMHDLLDSSFDENSTLDLSPRHVEDIQYSLTRIYRSAVSQVLVFSSCFRPDLFDNQNIIDAVESFILRDEKTKFSAIIRHPEQLTSRNAFVRNLANLQDKNPERVLIFIGSTKNLINCESNFSVSDGIRYRIAKEYENLKELIALGSISLVNAYDQETAGKLVATYERFLTHSKPIRLADHLSDMIDQ